VQAGIETVGEGIKEEPIRGERIEFWDSSRFRGSRATLVLRGRTMLRSQYGPASRSAFGLARGFGIWIEDRKLGIDWG